MKSFYTCLIASFILICAGRHCQSLYGQNLEWAIGIGSTYSDFAEQIETDQNGNIFIGGVFNGTVDFNTGPGVFNLTSTGSGSSDLFVLKMDSLHNFLWAIQIGNIDGEALSDLEVDRFGDVIVLGEFGGSADFDPGAGTYTLVAGGIYFDGFALKLDPSGNFQWAIGLGSSGSDSFGPAITDSTGDIYLTGTFEGTVDFDPGPGSFPLVAVGSFQDIFVLKVDSSGNFQWAESIGSPGKDYITDIVLTEPGNPLLAGAFQFTCDFDPGPGTYNLTSAGALDYFVLELNSTGSFAWAVSGGGVGSEICNTLRRDVYGNIISSGVFDANADFDPGPGIFMLNNSGSNDAYILKLDSVGDFMWAKGVGGANDDFAKGQTLDSAGNIYICGYFSGTVDFDPNAGIYNLMSSGSSSDIFMLKINAAGNMVWAQAIGNTRIDEASAIYMDSGNSFLMAGSFGITVDFDPGPGVTSLTSPGTVIEVNAFVTRWSQPLCSSLLFEADSVSEFTCASSSGFISVAAEGGTPPYTYLWSGIPPSTDSFLVAASPGIYYLTVSDMSGCSSERGFLLNSPTPVSGFDLNGNIDALTFRSGASSYLFVEGFNSGCIGVSGTLQLILDNRVTYISSVPPPDNISGDTLRWNFTDITYDSLHITPRVKVFASSSVVSGDTLCFALHIDPLASDVKPENNFKDNFCFPVLASYDPNDKQVYPRGLCAERFVQKDELLTYTIRFQNTGTADAIDVFILDSLDSDLDLNTVQVKAYSHPMHTEVLPGNILKFVFNDIHLPDSSSDEPGSHGYVIYEVMPETGLTDGTQIYNGSAIYFDFNPAVLTNVVMNTLMDSIPCIPDFVASVAGDKHELSVYPNPAHESITVGSDSPLGCIRILNSIGQEVMLVNGGGEKVVKMNVSVLPAGLYFLRCMSEDKMQITRLVVE